MKFHFKMSLILALSANLVLVPATNSIAFEQQPKISEDSEQDSNKQIIEELSQLSPQEILERKALVEMKSKLLRKDIEALIAKFQKALEFRDQHKKESVEYAIYLSAEDVFRFYSLFMCFQISAKVFLKKEYYKLLETLDTSIEANSKSSGILVRIKSGLQRLVRTNLKIPSYAIIPSIALYHILPSLEDRLFEMKFLFNEKQIKTIESLLQNLLKQYELNLRYQELLMDQILSMNKLNEQLNGSSNSAITPNTEKKQKLEMPEDDKMKQYLREHPSTDELVRTSL